MESIAKFRNIVSAFFERPRAAKILSLESEDCGGLIKTTASRKRILERFNKDYPNQWSRFPCSPKLVQCP